MQEVINFIEQEGSMHIAIIIINILLFLLASPIVKITNGGNEDRKQVAILRGLNMTFFIFQIIDLTLIIFDQQYKNFFSNMAFMLLIIYLAFILYNISGYIIRRKFGGSRDVDEKKVYIDTYNSRMITLLVVIVTTMIAIMMIIKLWGYDSLLETTGAFGVIIAFLALTNSIWAPDLYYGLVVLNSKMLEDGDVVTFEQDRQNIFIINKVNFVYTILLDVISNHRLIIRNAKMIDRSINNLSKKASLDGLRHNLLYNIGYPDIDTNDEQGYKSFKKKVDAIFKDAQTEAFINNEIKVNSNVDFTWLLEETGDHALKYNLTIHLESLPSTRSTRIVRKILLLTPKLVNEEVYKASLKQGISLATPFTLQQYNKNMNTQHGIDRLTSNN